VYLGVVIVGFTPLPCGYSTPIYCVAKHRGGGWDVFPFRFCFDFIRDTL